MIPFQFAWDIKRIVWQTNCSHILITAIKPFQILGLILFTAFRSSPLSISIVINTAEMECVPCGRAWRAKLRHYYRQLVVGAFQHLRKSPHDYSIKFFSDSEQLVYALADLGSIDVVPVPSLGLRAAGGNSPEKSSHAICFGYLGGSREEKGFPFFIDAINIVLSLGILADVTFIVQLALYENSSPKEKQAAELLRKLAATYSQIKILENNLTPQQFYSALQDIDVLVIPYSDPSYNLRTSGLFADGITAGKVLIVSADTWASQQVKRFDGGITYPMGDLAQLCRALVEAQRKWDDLARQAAEASMAWNKVNNPAQLFKTLFLSKTTEPSQTTIPDRSPKVT